jgi:hypothetical protein
MAQASACIEAEPRHIVEFQPGSAQIAGDQMVKLMEMHRHANERPGGYRVSVRGFADRATNLDPKAWTPEDVALADARARAISEMLRTLGNENCVERVALGNVPSDPPPERVDAAGRHWLSRGLVVWAQKDSKDTPQAGITIQTDCGPPAPLRGAGAASAP